MITFKQFIGEKVITPWKQSSIDDVSEAITLLNTNYKDGLSAISSGGLLFRGFKGADSGLGEIAVIDAAGSARTSRDSNNIYQLAMDRSSELKGFPSRSSSLICSASPDVAAGYGKAFVVIPQDGADVAVADSLDFLAQMFDTDFFGESPSAFNYAFMKFASFAGIGSAAGGKFTDYKKFQEALDAEDAYDLAGLLSKSLVYNTSQVAAKRSQLTKFFTKHKKNRFDALASKVMTPKNLSISKIKFGMPIQKNSECWVSGKCVIISYAIFTQILDELRKLGHPIADRYNRPF